MTQTLKLPLHNGFLVIKPGQTGNQVHLEIKSLKSQTLRELKLLWEFNETLGKVPLTVVLEDKKKTLIKLAVRIGLTPRQRVPSRGGFLVILENRF